MYVWFDDGDHLGRDRMISSKTPIAVDALFLERQRGPRTRIKWPLCPPFPKRTPAYLPFSKMRLRMSRLGSFDYWSLMISTPIIIPFPRTSPIYLDCVSSFTRLNSLSRYAPIYSAFKWYSYSSITFKTSLATLHSRGPAEKEGK
jgi:hypothetical protein